MRDVNTSIFKAYDIRGIYPESIDEDLAYAIAQGYVDYVKPTGEVLVGRDVRLFSETLQKKVIEGLLDAGVDVVDVGLISTEMCYFGVGSMNLSGGIQVTASHNPPEWHGIKMTKEKAAPLTGEEGIYQIREFVLSGKKISKTRGKLRKLDLLDEFCKFALTWIEGVEIKPLKMVYNPSFGFEGKVMERLVELGKLPITLIPLNAEPNGHFPKGRPDPFIVENRVEFAELVKSSGADFGVAWDADADRVFFCASGGLFLDSYYFNTILIKVMLKKFPGQKIIYDPRYTWALIDATIENGGEPVLAKVGHSYIKQAMREKGALFAGESSGHTYYRDFWFADSGMLPVMQMIEYLSNSEHDLLSEMRRVMSKYYISGEINMKVSGAAEIVEKVSGAYKDGNQSRFDGLTVEYPEYRFNIRTSNTEPLLRLNLEAKSKELMETKRDEVLKLMQS